MTNYRLEGSSECTPLTKAVAVLSADHPLTDAELLTLRPSEYQLITGKKKKNDARWTGPVGGLPGKYSSTDSGAKMVAEGHVRFSQ